MTERHDPEGSHYEKRTLAPVNIPAVTNEMDHEKMLFLIRCIDNSITPYSELTEPLQFTCESLVRKIVEIL